jgi:hypothetical protein
MKATNLLHQAMLTVLPPHRDGHQNGHQSGYMLHYCCIDCHLGGGQGDTEQVVARWRRSVASGEALVMLHWVMRSILHRRTAMAIEMARRRYICLPPPPILTAVIIAKDHCMVH